MVRPRTSVRAVTSACCLAKSSTPRSLRRRFYPRSSELGERYGITHIDAVLRGGRSKRIRESGHDTLSVFGIAKDHTGAEIKELAGLLTAEGLIYKNSREYATLGVTDKGWQFLKERRKLVLSRPKRTEENSPETH